MVPNQRTRLRQTKMRAWEPHPVLDLHGSFRDVNYFRQRLYNSSDLSC